MYVYIRNENNPGIIHNVPCPTSSLCIPYTIIPASLYTPILYSTVQESKSLVMVSKVMTTITIANIITATIRTSPPTANNLRVIIKRTRYQKWRQNTTPSHHLLCCYCFVGRHRLFGAFDLGLIHSP